VDNQTAVIVNGEEIGLRDLLHGYKVRHGAQFLEEAIRHALIRQAAGSAPIRDEDLQQAADDFRRQFGLYEAEPTHQWLASQGLSVQDFEERLAATILARRVRDQVSDGQVDSYFAANRAAMDQASVSRIVVAEEEVAAELLAQIAEEGADFAAVAREYSTDEATRQAGGFAGPASRASLGADAEALVFGSEAGQTVGPVKTDGGWAILRVETLRPAQLDEATREHIKDLLFGQWLQEQRAKASIETPLLAEL
jgi:putative peptide maturation system protein